MPAVDVYPRNRCIFAAAEAGEQFFQKCKSELSVTHAGDESRRDRGLGDAYGRCAGRRWRIADKAVNRGLRMAVLVVIGCRGPEMRGAGMIIMTRKLIKLPMSLNERDARSPITFVSPFG
jgi:hypothetical protein